MALGCHDIPFTKSHTPLAPIGLLEKASFSRLSPLSMGRICLQYHTFFRVHEEQKLHKFSLRVHNQGMHTLSYPATSDP